MQSRSACSTVNCRPQCALRRHTRREDGSFRDTVVFSVLRDEWPIDEVLSRFGGIVRHVRGRDATKGADRRTKPAPLGRGDTNWPDLLASLDAAAYAGWVTVDPVDLPDRAAAAASGLAELRKVTGSRQ